MDYLTILAEAASNSGAEAAEETTVVPIDVFWNHISTLGLLEALTFVSFGAVCLFYGWRVFKILVVICFGLLGLVLGITVTNKVVGLNNQLMGGLIGMVLLSVLSVPLMRWAVCILGAMAGGTVTSGIWYACGLPESMIWAGALIGMIGGGMISFIVFKVAVILFSSLGGSALLVAGLLAVLCSGHIGATEQVQNLVLNHKWFLPVALIIPTAVGVIVQHKFVKGSKDWNI
jgi:hypothetical protein